MPFVNRTLKLLLTALVKPVDHLDRSGNFRRCSAVGIAQGAVVNDDFRQVALIKGAAERLANGAVDQRRAGQGIRPPSA